MSDFLKLKDARKSREVKKSFIASSLGSSKTSSTAQQNTSDGEMQDIRSNFENAVEIESGGPMEVDALSTTNGVADNTIVVDNVAHSVTDAQRTESQEHSNAYNAVDGMYAALPPGFEIRLADGDRGRGVYTKVPRKAGDILFSVRPHVAALSSGNLLSYCSKCFGFGQKLERCPKCKVNHYCDSACQTADWSKHKQECLALQRWAAQAIKSSAEPGSNSPPMSAIPSDAIRCLGRILWKKRKGGPASVWSKEIDALQSNRTSISKSLDTQDSQLHAHLAHAVVRYLDISSPQEMADYGLHSASDLVDLVSRFTTNTFTVTTPTLTPIGACVSPIVALINHSCDPNASVVFPRGGGPAKKDQEPLLQVVALKPIEAGEEVLTSYIDTTLPKHLRQQALRETYHFICRCSLCAHPTEPIDLRDAMYCPKKCGGLCRLPAEEDPLTRCTQCKSAVKDTDAVLDATRVGEEALKKAERLQFSDPAKARQLTTNLIPILTSVGVVPSAHPLLALFRLHTSLLISKLSEQDIEEIRSPQLEEKLGPSGPGTEKTNDEAQEELDNCVRSATRTCTGLSQILPFGHPVRALAVAELGKLLAVDEPAPKHVAREGDNSPLSLPSPLHTPGLPSPAANPVAYPPSGPARLKLAYQTLVRAQDELMIGFGRENEGGEVGKDIRSQIVDVEKELTVWRTRGKEAVEDELKRGK